jgi:hypothetical protein
VKTFFELAQCARDAASGSARMPVSAARRASDGAAFIAVQIVTVDGGKAAG